jgi:signal transduction histidine kinase
MSEPHPMSRRDEWLEFWERRELSFFMVLPYPLLALCVLFDLITRHGLNQRTWIDLGLAAVLLVLMATIDRLDRHRTSWTEPQTALSPALAAGVFTALGGISLALVIRQPLYGFYAWTGYFWAWRLLTGRWRLAGIALVAATLAISQTGSGPYRGADRIGGLLVVFLVDLCIAGGLNWFGWVGNEQQQRRAREVSALTAANAKLEESLRHNADLHEQLLTHARETGISEERRRMAQEIHDTLAQGLTGIITQLQAAQRAGTGESAGARHLESAIALARESLTEARRSVQALAPEPLVDARLPDALQDVAQRWSDLHEIPATLTVTGSSRAVRPDIEVALLRTTQEALANVGKHAHAHRVGLTLSYMPDLVTLDVRDDGVGFSTINGAGPRRPRHLHGGFGLTSMRQRIEGIGGTLEIESEPDVGTAISAAVPAPVDGAPR